MLRAEAGQAEIYRPGPYWQPYQQRVTRAIHRYGLGDFRARPAIGKGYADTPTTRAEDVWAGQGSLRYALKRALARAPVLRGMFTDYEAIVDNNVDVGRRYRDAYLETHFGNWFRTLIANKPLPDTAHAGCTDLVRVGDQEVARLYLEFLMRIDNYARHVDFGRMRTALEIGGGFGAWVHLLLSRYPNVRKVAYLDIPPMIYVGTQYLRHFFGPAVRDFRQTDTGGSIRFANDDSLEIVCLCPWQIERLEAPLDLFWNTSSFAEMTPAIVGNYARHVNRLMKPDGALCVLINKASKRDPARTSTPDQIFAAFEGKVGFKTFDPAVEIDGHALYSLGRPVSA